jgi:hypothetical protein
MILTSDCFVDSLCVCPWAYVIVIALQLNKERLVWLRNQSALQSPEKNF